MIFLDTETALIQPGLLAPPLTCIQFAQDAGPVVVAVADVDPVEGLLEEILQDEVIGHNLAYDLLVILREYPSLAPLIFEAKYNDTLTREKLRLIRDRRLKGAGLSLAALAEKYGTAKDPNDPWRLRYSELRGVPFESWPVDARTYATHDVEATRTVYLAQGSSLPDEHRQARAAFLMHYISSVGVSTDPQAVRDFEAQITVEHQRNEAWLISEGLVRPGGERNTKAARIRMAQVMEKPLLTATYQISLSEEACTLSGDPLLQAYQAYGSFKGLLSRIQRLKAPRIWSRFDSLLETGRTSCSIGDHGYQLQNMRRTPGERECFVPRPGRVFLGCDYSGAELCTLAQVCLWAVGESRLAEALNAGLDPHLYAAAVALGEDYDLILQEKNTPRVKELRQGMKIANFGYPGGMGSAAFVGYARGFGLDITPERSQELRDMWLATWPEMSRYFAWVNGHPWRPMVRGDHFRDVTTVTQFDSGRIRGGCTYTETCNSYFQGLAADMAKDAGYELFRAVEIGSLRGWEIWNFVHDEYLLEGPEEDGDRAAREVQRIMVDTAQRWVPDVRISAEPVLMRRWSKEAEPVRVNGLLIPWEG